MKATSYLSFGAALAVAYRWYIDGVRFNALTAFFLAFFVTSWLPELLIKIRFFVFQKINDTTSLEVPCEGIRGKTFKWLYNNKAVNLRSIQSGYGLSDFFWYLLAPAHSIHQEHTETEDIRYKITSTFTRKICNVRKDKLERLASKYTRRLLLKKNQGGFLSSWEASRFWIGSTWKASSDACASGGNEEEAAIVRLRDLFFPVFERILFEIVFDCELPDELNQVICDSAENVINAIKGGTPRDMTKRKALTQALERFLRDDPNGRKLEIDPRICAKEWALFLQGVFFTTAVVQLSEGIAHIGVALAQNPKSMRRLRETLRRDAATVDDEGNDEEGKGASPVARSKISQKKMGLTSESFSTAIVTEALRLWPLFGDAHRITSDTIRVPRDLKKKERALSESEDDVVRVIPKGTVLIFNYPKFHADGARSSYGSNHADFEPMRWVSKRTGGGGLTERNENIIPFGVAGNRPCPGKRISQILLRSVTREMVKHVDFYSPVEHTRSLPCGGLCVVKKRVKSNQRSTVCSRSTLIPTLLVHVYVSFDSLRRSFLQLVHGAAQLRESRKLKLAGTFFSHYPPSAKGMMDRAHKPCPTNQKDEALRC